MNPPGGRSDPAMEPPRAGSNRRASWDRSAARRRWELERDTCRVRARGKGVAGPRATRWRQGSRGCQVSGRAPIRWVLARRKGRSGAGRGGGRERKMACRTRGGGPGWCGLGRAVRCGGRREWGGEGEGGGAERRWRGDGNGFKPAGSCHPKPMTANINYPCE